MREALGADGAVGIIKWKDNLIETVEDLSLIHISRVWKWLSGESVRAM